MMRVLIAMVAGLLGAVLLAPFILLALPFLIVSAGTRILSRLFEPAYLTRDQLIQFDPVFGWKPRANLNTHHLMADLFWISTDAHGWRGRSTLEQSDIVVFGDSFAAGYGVGEEHIFANLQPRPRIKPIGIGGYSMVQELLWMRELASALRGKLVVWFIYTGNDLYDNLSPELRGYRKPFVRQRRGSREWEIVSHHVTPEKWPIGSRLANDQIHMSKLAELCADTFLAERAFSACEFLIGEGRRVCLDAGAELRVLTVPDMHQLDTAGRRYLQSLGPQLKGFDSERPDRAIESICLRLGVPFVAGSSFLDVTCYKQNDCHWNPLGHRRVAARLADLHASHRGAESDQERWQSATAVISRKLDQAAKSAS